MVAENNLTGYKRSLRHGDIICRIGVQAVFTFYSKTTAQICKFFQDLGDNTCSLQPAVKNAAPGLLQSQY